MSADKALQAIEDAKTGPDAFECVRHYTRVKQHYDHAREKHPYFCDKLFVSEKDINFRLIALTRLSRVRELLPLLVADDRASAETLLECEFFEAEDAFANGDTAHAVEELYDCIAVCLRTIDVLEGRQPLGKPEGGVK